MKRKGPLERFWDKVVKADGDECWGWLASTFPDGYGNFHVDGKNLGAHRFMWAYVLKRELPPGMFICHHCDNPPCVNPAHLFIGTAQDNIDDKVAKGRHGYGLPNTKLTESQVVFVLSSPLVSARKLASQFSVTRQTINLIRQGKRWKHIHPQKAA